jgi:hypothetical protein
MKIEYDLQYFNIIFEIIQIIIDIYQILCIIPLITNSAILPKEAVMFDQVIIEFMKMSQKKIHRGYEWTQEFIKPVPVKLSLMDRVLPAVGESLIKAGNKLKQRTHARLTAEHAQTPTFMIML